MRRRTSSGSRAGSRPKAVMEPRSGVRKPSSVLSSVVFPAPFGPSRPVGPGGNAPETPVSAATGPYETAKALNSTSAGAGISVLNEASLPLVPHSDRTGPPDVNAVRWRALRGAMTQLPAATIRASVDEAETVLGIDNIPLALPVASLGSRALAAALDYLIVGLVATLLIVGFALLITRLPRWGVGWMAALMILGFFLLEYGYFAGVEVFTGGRSFGKWVLDLRVVSHSGGKASVGALLLRNMVRLLDLVVGVWLMLLDPLSRRL